jgi:uncharacterized protein YjbI with pentapeptide repeats
VAKQAEARDPQEAIRARFLEHGTDPAIAKKAIEDATGLSRGLWLSFLTFGTYLVITFAGVDHRDLLLETPVTLPVLNAPLPLVTFFWVAPILFVIFHLYLLLSLKLLADQVHNYVGQMEEVGLDSDAQDRARLQLPNFVVVQVLGGTSAQVNSWAGRLLGFTAFLTLVAGPLILLLFAQLMFLPYHGWGVTMAQRVLVMVDLAFIWYFWRAITRREGLHFSGSVASVGLAVLTFFGFMYPGEKFYGVLPKMVFVETGIQPESVGFDLFYNTLFLPNERIVDEDHFKKLELRNKEKGLLASQGERTLEVTSNRDFRFANFDSIDLRKANLNNSILDGAHLGSASLNGVTFNYSSLLRSDLGQATLSGASLDSARFDGASFNNSDMRGTLIRHATLRGAYLVFTSLQAADLTLSDLDGANLKGARLHGALLAGTMFKGANLDKSELQGSTFNGIFFDNLFLRRQILKLQFKGATLRSAKIWAGEGKPDLSLTDTADLQVAPHGITANALQIEHDKMLAAAVSGMPEPDSTVIIARLRRLHTSRLISTEETHWLEAAEKQKSNTGAEEKWVNALIEIACSEEISAYDAPYVVEGIIRNHLDIDYAQVDKQELPLIDRILDDCPGANGIDPAIIQSLKNLRAAPAADEPQPIILDDE